MTKYNCSDIIKIAIDAFFERAYKKAPKQGRDIIVKIAICDDSINDVNIIENYIDKFNKAYAECDAYKSGEE